MPRRPQPRGNGPGIGGAFGGLPHARQEGRAIARRLRGSTLWTGDAASEDALKKARLEDFRLLHFAAHAVADEERPERSAVLLAPGGDKEDGLLQSREIVELPSLAGPSSSPRAGPRADPCCGAKAS